MSIRTALKLFPAISFLLLFALCARIADPGGEGDANLTGEAEITVDVGEVGRLAKTMRAMDIVLDSLFLTISAPEEDSIKKAFALSGNGQSTVSWVVNDLSSEKTWTLSARTKDEAGETVHTGSTTFEVEPGEMGTVSLALQSLFSILEANFYPIRDSVTQCVLVVNGEVKAETTFTLGSMVGDTVQLTYDYLQAGQNHTVEMIANGSMNDSVYVLYQADTTVNAAVGEYKTMQVTLDWVGPTPPPAPGQAHMRVSLGPIPRVKVYGELEDRNGPAYDTLPRRLIAADTISANETWSGDSVYVITRPVVIDSGTTLDIRPGATVLFNRNTFIQCSGEMLALGSADNRILFSSAADTQRAGDYGGIRVYTGAVRAIYDSDFRYVSGTAFRYCDFEYGGGITMYRRADLYNCSFKNCGRNVPNHECPGVVEVSLSGSCKITKCTFMGNRNDWDVRAIRSPCLFLDSCEFLASKGFHYYGRYDGNDSAFVRNCLFRGRQSIHTSRCIAEFENTAFENGSTIQGQGNRFRNCLFKHNDRNSHGRHFAFCTFYDCSGVRVQNGGGGIFRFNNFYDGSKVFRMEMDGPNDIDASKNYWHGLTDSAAISERVIDYWDDFDASKGKINFMPPRSSPMPDNPDPFDTVANDEEPPEEEGQSSPPPAFPRDTLSFVFADSLKAPLYRHSAVVFNQGIWCFGGHTSSDAQTQDLQHSTDGLNWTRSLCDSSLRRFEHSSVVFDNKIWVIGGHTLLETPQQSRSVWYSSDGSNWTSATTDAPFGGRQNHSTVTFDGKIWVIGGFSDSPDSTGSKRNDVWHSENGTDWTLATASAGFSPRGGHEMLVYNGKMWLFGGRAYEGTYLDKGDVWCSADGVNWTRTKDDLGCKVVGAVVFESHMLVIGNLNDNETMCFYSNDGITWEQVPTGADFNPYLEQTATVVFDNKIWVIGGDNGEGASWGVWCLE